MQNICISCYVGYNTRWTDVNAKHLYIMLCWLQLTHLSTHHKAKRVTIGILTRQKAPLSSIFMQLWNKVTFVSHHKCMYLSFFNKQRFITLCLGIGMTCGYILLMHTHNCLSQCHPIELKLSQCHPIGLKQGPIMTTILPG